MMGNVHKAWFGSIFFGDVQVLPEENRRVISGVDRCNSCLILLQHNAQLRHRIDTQDET